MGVQKRAEPLENTRLFELLNLWMKFLSVTIHLRGTKSFMRCSSLSTFLHINGLREQPLTVYFGFCFTRSKWVTKKPQNSLPRLEGYSWKPNKHRTKERFTNLLILCIFLGSIPEQFFRYF